MSISSVDSGPLHLKPEVDLNLATEANRILYVLNKLIERVQFVGLLQYFFEDGAVFLSKVLDSQIFSQISKRCERYKAYPKKPSATTTSRSARASASNNSDGNYDDDDDYYDDDDDDDDEDYDSRSQGKDTIGNVSRYQTASPKQKLQHKRKNDELAEVINLLEENPQVKMIAQELKDELSPGMKFFVKTLIEFKNLMEKRLTENATQYKRRQRYMRETYEKNELAKKEIEKLEEELIVTKTEANVCIIGRNILIKRHQNKVDKVKTQLQEAVEKRVNESEKEMVNCWKESSVRQETLKSDLHQATEKYSTLLRDHLAVEKALRAKRSKVENQVLGWIQKFDQDIGEKQAEEEQIQELLDSEMKEVNEIQNKLDEQEEEYDELMQEKAEYEDEMLERRMYQFIMNRSARRIQRSFRMYKARKLAKKLAKKGKKGKKKK